MKDKLSDEQTESILRALNKAIEQGPWESSNFLRMLGKKLVTLRDGLLDQLGSREFSFQQRGDDSTSVQLTEAQQPVYISLYSANGENLTSWERILANLPRQMISRPIYANEEHIKEALRLKLNKLNDAYVTAYINKTDIINIPADRVLVDKQGNPLLSLKDNSLTLSNIIYFTHPFGTYRFSKGRLEKLG